MSTGAAADLFAPRPRESEHDQVLRDVVMPGLDRLASARPLWPIGVTQWAVVIACVRAFAQAWHARACGRGWPLVLLYGMHRLAPYGNVAAMGAFFLAARPGHQPIGVTKDAIELVTAAGARLRFYRASIDPAAVVAWSLLSDLPERKR